MSRAVSPLRYCFHSNSLSYILRFIIHEIKIIKHRIFHEIKIIKHAIFHEIKFNNGAKVRFFSETTKKVRNKIGQIYPKRRDLANFRMV